ncbi:uncharacterized protein LOC144110895 [Amblyomma americanum]
MLPRQPFYSSVNEFRLNSVTATHCPGVVSYSGHFSTTPESRSHRTLVLVHFTLMSQSSAISGRTATVRVNGRAYRGLPLTVVNITQLLYRLPADDYDLCLEGIPADVTVHVDEVMKMPEWELFSIIGRGAPFEFTQKDTWTLIRAQLGSDQVETKVLKVSLDCPLAQRTMNIPCRGVRCSHAQCFDVYSYLGCNEATLEPSWRCPVCREKVFVQDIRVDLFTLDILIRAGARFNAVEIRADGSCEFPTSGDDRNVSGGEDSSAKAEAAP